MDVSRTQSKRMQLLVWLAAMLAVLITLPVTARAEVAHGESGTVKWSISDAGELVFEPEDGKEGTFANDLQENSNDEYPYEYRAWNRYFDDIDRVRFVGTCHAKGSVSYMFSSYSYGSMQSQASAIDLKGLETSGATDMSSMFAGCSFVR